MSDVPNGTDLQQLWQNQGVGAPRISLEFVRHRTLELKRRAQRRNAFEYCAVTIGIVFYGWFIWRFPMPIVRTGLVFLIIGLSYVTFRWHQRAAFKDAPATAGVLDALAFHHQQLERQRDARQNNWRWYVLPLVPGVLTIFIGVLLERHPISWVRFWIALAAVIVSATTVVLLNEKAARRLQQEINALDSLTSGESREDRGNTTETENR
jgi:hypothetical protein